MSNRITKKDAKSALDKKIKHLREKFNQGDYEFLLETQNNIIPDNQLHELVHHLGGHVMRLNHQLGLPHMTKREIDEYHRVHGSGFFDSLWSGIKSVGKTVFNVARPLVKPVGDVLGAKYGIPAGTIADEGLKTFGMGIQNGGSYRSGGRYRSGGATANPATRTAQRKMTPEDY